MFFIQMKSDCPAEPDTLNTKSYKMSESWYSRNIIVILNFILFSFFLKHMITIIITKNVFDSPKKKTKNVLEWCGEKHTSWLTSKTRIVYCCCVHTNFYVHILLIIV